ncbi:MAG TPA: hypothetical protein PLQ45_04405 [Anaerohalosphaeraceae bacterium]|jgi:hypothetical protein|nr:hypothetical protein [Anaerohalosphaeraceae bacterium]
MKKCTVWAFLCVIGAAAQAVLIDDFSDASLAEYTKSVVLEQSGTNAISFAAPNGAIQVSKAADNGAEQVLLLRDDYSLDVGDTLRIDTMTDQISSYADFGIAISATVDPPDAVWTSGTADVRQNYMNIYVKGQYGTVGYVCFDGTTNIGSSSGVSVFPSFGDLIGLFITRISPTVFDLGYTTTEGDTVIRTFTVANTAIGTAIGFYADVRAEITYGDMDNLRIWSIRYEAHNPNPADGADKVGVPIGSTGKVEVTLGWKAGIDQNGVYPVNPAIKKHHVYLSKDQTVYTADPNLYYIGSVDQTDTSETDAEYVPDPPLNSGGRYLWMVEEGLDNGQGGVFGPGDPNNIAGKVWTFETISTIPVIQTQPAAAMVVLGATADPAFTIDVFSTTDAHYQWYYSDDEAIGFDVQVGSDQPSLEIVNAQMSDQGYYYCRIWNSATVSGGGANPDVYSDAATLTIGRLVAAYTFDNDLNDSSGEGNHGKAKDLSLQDPNLAALTFSADRIQGTHSLRLDGVGQYVDFGTAAYPKAGPLTGGIGGGLDEGTITCWVKASKVGGLLSNYNNGITTGFAMSLETSGATADARINVRGEAAEITTIQGRPGMTGFDMLTDDQWHMLTVVWKAGTSGTVYVDGGPAASDDTLGTPELYVPWQRGVLLGSTRTMANRDVLDKFYGGQIDDLRVYNYRRTPEQIAHEYFTVTGNAACTNPNFEGSAFNFDNTIGSYCRIDLADLAVFIRNWLANGLSTGQ